MRGERDAPGQVSTVLMVVDGRQRGRKRQASSCHSHVQIWAESVSSHVARVMFDQDCEPLDRYGKIVVAHTVQSSARILGMYGDL